MSDTTARNPVSAPKMLADALMRSTSGTMALLRVTGTNAESSQLELGLIATTFYDVVISPAVMRKQKPGWAGDGGTRWELLLSATSIEAQVLALALASAQALFALTLSVTVAEQEYLIESVGSNEAFGSVYLYRLLLRQSNPQSL